MLRTSFISKQTRALSYRAISTRKREGGFRFVAVIRGRDSDDCA